MRKFTLWLAAGVLLAICFCIGWLLAQDYVTPWLNGPIEKEARHG